MRNVSEKSFILTFFPKIVSFMRKCGRIW